MSGAPGKVLWFQWTPACLREKPQLRPAKKNHRLSRLIGPPRLIDWSHSFSVSFDVLRPCSRSSGVRFWPSMALLAKNPARIPLKVLPPSFGMTLTTAPSAFVSAEMPVVCSTISCTAAALIW